MKNKSKFFLIGLIAIFTFSMATIALNKREKTLNTDAMLISANVLSNKKIGWGIKRQDNHQQPDLGRNNKEIIDKYSAIAMGNSTDKYVYLTFDEGYEAGYTPRILEVLKQNNVKATFFLTAHYINTQEELVRQMIKEGHIIGNHTPKYLMSRKQKIIKC